MESPFLDIPVREKKSYNQLSNEEDEITLKSALIDPEKLNDERAGINPEEFNSKLSSENEYPYSAEFESPKARSSPNILKYAFLLFAS